MRTQLRAAALAAAVLMVFATAAAGQAPQRTPDGQPDLQGVWDFRSAIPFERRSSDFGGAGAGIR